MKISVVTTLYKSAPYVQEFYERIKDCLRKITSDYEIIFVDDGSPDDSLTKALKIQETDSRTIVIELSRNFGQHKALMTGLKHSSGDFVFVLDSDLEESPEWLEQFYQKLQEENCDVVYGVQQKRKGKWFERISGNIFYRLMNTLTDLDLSPNLVTTRLMTRDYVNSLLLFNEKEIFLAGLWQITGYKQIPITVTKKSNSQTSYSVIKKMTIFINAVTSFTNKPLIYIFGFGFVISLIAVVYIFYLITAKIFYAHPISGWVSLIVSVWFLGGIIILFMGVIGIYLSKIFIETKNRPYTIVKKLYQHEHEQSL